MYSLIHQLFVCTLKPFYMIAVNNVSMLHPMGFSQKDFKRIWCQPIIGIQL
ncbi:hypothetical protein GCM10008915_71990 [Bifidobacterium pullorum subsp. gallinarum]